MLAFVFTGGLKDEVAPVLVAGDGTVTDEVYPESKNLTGGFAVIEVPTRDEAEMWAAKIAVACCGSQELREPEREPPFTISWRRSGELVSAGHERVADHRAERVRIPRSSG